jgi:hypothetical protein
MAWIEQFDNNRDGKIHIAEYGNSKWDEGYFNGIDADKDE